MTRAVCLHWHARHWYVCQRCGGWRRACVRCGHRNPSAGQTRQRGGLTFPPCACAVAVRTASTAVRTAPTPGGRP